MNHQSVIRLLIALGVIASSACVPLPVATPGETPFKDVTEGFFVVGTTVTRDVEDKLGEPHLRGDGWWLYRDTRDGWQWAFCVGGGYSAGCGAWPRGSTDYFFVVDFDNNDVVSAFELFTEDELCDERQICYEGNILMRAAAQADDTEAKLFRVPPAGCSVYTYSTTDSDSAAGELIIDGEIVGGLVGPSGYYVHSVAEGPHAWIVVPSREKHLPLLIARTSFECQGRQAAYLRYRNGLWGVKIESVSADRGHQDIRERWLAISTPERNEMLRSNWLRDGEIYVTKSTTSFSAYQFVDGEKIPRWGATDLGEPCGVRAAIEDYGLSPVGSHAVLNFAESLTVHVQLRTVCRAGSACQIMSAIDGESCDVESADTIEFEPWGKLLLLEAHGGAYTELYYGDAKALKKISKCSDGRCTISTDELRARFTASDL